MHDPWTWTKGVLLEGKVTLGGGGKEGKTGTIIIA